MATNHSKRFISPQSLVAIIGTGFFCSSNWAQTAPTPAASAPTASVAAKPALSGWALETNLSTLGLGLGVSANLPSVTGLSAAVTGHYLQYQGDFDSGQSSVNAKLNLSRILAQARYQLGGTGTYATGGVSFGMSPSILTGIVTPANGSASSATVLVGSSGSAIDGTATVNWNGNRYTIPAITESVTYQGTTYTPAQINAQITANPTLSVNSATLKVKYKQVSPYFGIGWTSDRNAAGWGFRTELGAIFMSKPDIQVTIDGTAPDAAKAGFLQSIDKDITKARDAAKKFKTYPVLGFTVLYRF